MRTWHGVGIALLYVTAAQAQTFPLTETPQAGDCHRYTLELTVTGELKLTQDGKPAPQKIQARALHQFSEKTLVAGTKAQPRKSARTYAKAEVGYTSADAAPRANSLRPERALTVAQRTNGAFTCYSPAGPLTQDELSVVGEHFDTMSLTDLLPGKEMKEGESWPLDNSAVQALCQFDALINQTITGKIEKVENGSAVLKLAGNADGIEKGARVKVTVTATARFDLLAKKLVALQWNQHDERDQGPAGPASVLDGICILTRAAIEEPKELNRVALESVPDGFEVKPALTSLMFREPSGRFEVTYPRDWVIVAQTSGHTVLRLLERGDFLAQVTLTPWKNAGPGKHLSVDDLRQVLLTHPGLELESVTKPAEKQTPNGRYECRVSGDGDVNGSKAMVTCALLADTLGNQVIAMFEVKPSAVAKVGGRDQELLDAVQLLPAK